MVMKFTLDEILAQITENWELEQYRKLREDIKFSYKLRRALL